MAECGYCVHEVHAGFRCGQPDARYGECACQTVDAEGFRYKLDSAECSNTGKCIPGTERGRQQRWLGVESMELIGWRKIAGKWVCPFCTGNIANLMKIFKRAVDE